MYIHHRRNSAASGVTTLVALAICIPLELCTDHGYSTHSSRYQRMAREEAPVTVPKPTPHMTGAFYPDEHPEMFVEHAAPTGTSTSVVPYISAGLGGLAVAGIFGTAAFLVLGLVDREPDHLDLDGAD